MASLDVSRRHRHGKTDSYPPTRISMNDISHPRLPRLDSPATLLAPVLAIIFGTTVAIASLLSPKWFISIAVTLIFSCAVLAAKEKERCILFVSVLLLPVSFDFYLVNLKSLPYSLPISGFRVTAFDLCFFFLLGSWLIRLAIDRQTQLRLYPYISVPFAFLLMINLASSVFSPLPLVIKLSYIWYAMENWLIFLYIANNVRDRRTVFVLVALFLSSAIIQSLLAMAQYATGGTLGLDLFGESEKGYFTMRAGAGTINRVAGTLGHPNKLGMFLGMWLPIAMSLIFGPLRARHKFLLISAFLLMSIGDILTLSRGAWLSLGVGLIIVTYLCILNKTRHRIISFFMTTALLSAIAFVALIAITPVKKRLLEDDYGTASTRMPLAKLALSMIGQNPFLGIGQGSFVAVANKYDRTREGISYSFPAPVHNSYLLIAAEIGIPALGCFLMILGYAFFGIMRMAKVNQGGAMSYLGVGLLGGLSTWAVHQLVDYDYVLFSSIFWFYIGLIIAGAQIASPSLPEETSNMQRTSVFQGREGVF